MAFFGRNHEEYLNNVIISMSLFGKRNSDY